MSEKTKQKLLDSLAEIIAQDKSVNIKSVAENAGLSHSVIYNRYPELKIIIKTAQKKQKAQDETQYYIKVNEKLKSDLKVAKRKLGRKNTEQCETIPALLAHIQQVYSMYDQILEERNDFARQLRSMKKQYKGK